MKNKNGFVNNKTYIHVITDKYHTHMKVSVFDYPNLGGMILHKERDVTTHNKERIYSWARDNDYPVYHWKQDGFMEPYTYSPSISQPIDPRGE
tara:strand:- start:51 stop:329 length:279 start_codon:yes stop_codon:yes gene_type:complete